jgi:ribosome-associated toxin RatA of RatAB toxin-antitoxin module
MRTVTRSLLIEAAPDEVFALIDSPDRYPEFFVGMTRWESVSERTSGLGARYRVLMKVGSIEAGGTVKVAEWSEPETIAWCWERGIHQEGRWELEPRDGGTEVTLEVSFDLSGGPVGRVVELIAGRIVGRNLYATLLAARRLVEDRASSQVRSSGTI